VLDAGLGGGREIQRTVQDLVRDLLHRTVRPLLIIFRCEDFTVPISIPAAQAETRSQLYRTFTAYESGILRKGRYHLNFLFSLRGQKEFLLLRKRI